MTEGRQAVVRWVGLAALLALAWLCYRPGLSGGFLFDDFVNLNALGATGPVDDWATFWRYVTSGTADPTGRPLAMLSFLLDARDWPAEPASFLRTNVLLHLLNGALLFALLRKLGQCLASTPAHNDAAALLGAGLWLLHPLLVSTTLYAVQRQAMLPATFTLLGLFAYASGRLEFSASGGIRGTRRMVAGILVGTALALASKGNGVLLPLLAWVLEATIFARLPVHDAHSKSRLARLKFWLLILPSLLVFTYLARWLPAMFQPSGVRSFSIYERLLTEPRVLLDYLQLLVVPRSVSTGLYNDGYVVSRALTSPWQTLPALAIIVALPCAAFAARHRFPALASAILFFFAGHLLESSLIPLELYFEHRNYLPAMLLGWPLALALSRWKRPRALRAAVALALLSLLALTTFQRATLWGQPAKLAALWAMQDDGSSRAQASAAIADLNAGRSAEALQRLAPLWQANPRDLQIAFNYISARCETGGPTAEDKRKLADALRRTPTSVLLTHEWLASSIEVAAAGQCPGLGLDDVEEWVSALDANPVFGASYARDQDVEPLYAMIALARRQPAQALVHFDRALRSRPDPDTAARQASMLAMNEAYAEALAHLDTYEQVKSQVPQAGAGMGWVHARVLERQEYWPREMAILRRKLRDQLAHEAAR